MSESLHRLHTDKKSLRERMQNLRAMAAAKHPDAALDVRDLFLKSVTLPPDVCVALTMAHKDELDPMPLALALLAKGHPLCLPAVTGKNQSLVFRIWKPGDPLVAGSMGIPQPPESAPPAKPAVLLVPLLAFDRRGFRLGQGGGYYDRTLAQLRKNPRLLAVGLGYAAQEAVAVPAAAHDMRLDIIVTEREVIWPNPATG